MQKPEYGKKECLLGKKRHVENSMDAPVKRKV
jgi:hypothetical protein